MSLAELRRLAALERLAAGTLTQRQVALQLRLSVRQVRRLWKAFQADGAVALQSKRRGRPGNRRIDPGTIGEALELVQRHYADCGPTFAAEKLLERHGLRLDHETLRRALIAAGRWVPTRNRRRTPHPPRDRRPCFGELAQIDGSHHPWFETRAPKCTLYVDVDDATSALLALHFAEQETTEGYFELVRQHITNYGVPFAFYSDKYSVFRLNLPATTHQEPTQFGRALQQLDIQLICANSPQAKGRVERANGTLQDRLVKELRYRNISTIAEANAFVPEFIRGYNDRFAKLPASDADAHRTAPDPATLERILSVQFERTVTPNLTVHFEGTIYQILRPDLTRRLQHTKVCLRRDRYGKLTIDCRGTALPYRASLTQRLTPIRDAKSLASSDRRQPNPKKAHTPPISHPWKGPSYRAASRGHFKRVQTDRTSES